MLPIGQTYHHPPEDDVVLVSPSTSPSGQPVEQHAVADQLADQHADRGGEPVMTKHLASHPPDRVARRRCVSLALLTACSDPARGDGHGQPGQADDFSAQQAAQKDIDRAYAPSCQRDPRVSSTSTAWRTAR